MIKIQSKKIGGGSILYSLKIKIVFKENYLSWLSFDDDLG